MNFYLINEQNTCNKLAGTNKEIYDQAIHGTKAQKSTIGFIGVIDNNHRVRASLLFNRTDLKVFTKVTCFIRKYSAIGVLEEIAKISKENNAFLKEQS